MKSENQDPFVFCQHELKRLDPVSHFAALTIPEAKRPAIMALYAFLASIKRIPDRVSSKEMGHIRLQWWRDIIASPGDEFSSGCGCANIGPLATALKEAQHQFRLPPDQFDVILDAYAFSLENEPIETTEEYDRYAKNTHCVPLLLACQILNDGVPSQEAAPLCLKAGQAISLANHLHTWTSDIAAGRTYLPQESFEPEGLSLNKSAVHATKAAIGALCDTALEHHTSAMQLLLDEKGATSQLAAAFIPLATVPLLAKARKKKPTEPIKLATWRSYWAMWRLAVKL